MLHSEDIFQAMDIISQALLKVRNWDIHHTLNNALHYLWQQREKELNKEN